MPSRPSQTGSGSGLHEIQDEREQVERALVLAEGNRERAASMLGMSRTTLWRRMKAHGLLSDRDSG